MLKVLADNEQARRICWAIAAFVSACIAVGVFAPRDPVPKMVHGQDSFEHFVAFGLLAGLVLAPPGRRWWRVALLVEAIVLIELIQGYVIHTRNMQIDDALWGLAGVACASVALCAANALEGPLGRMFRRDIS